MTKKKIKTVEEKLALITERQNQCNHLEEFIPVHQEPFKDDAKGVMVLITTILCKKCGNLFFDTQETNIKTRISIIPTVIPEGGKNEQSKN